MQTTTRTTGIIQRDGTDYAKSEKNHLEKRCVYSVVYMWAIVTNYVLMSFYSKLNLHLLILPEI